MIAWVMFVCVSTSIITTSAGISFSIVSATLCTWEKVLIAPLASASFAFEGIRIRLAAAIACMAIADLKPAVSTKIAS